MFDDDLPFELVGGRENGQVGVNRFCQKEVCVRACVCVEGEVCVCVCVCGGGSVRACV